MSDYQNQTERVVNLGLNLRDVPERLESGKWRRLTNVRSDEEGALTSRPGRVLIFDVGVDDVVHTLVKLDDVLVSGVGSLLYRNNTAYATTWLAMPKTTVRHRASLGEDKWLYVADAGQMRMLHADGTDYQWGITAPQVGARYEAAGAVGSGNLNSGGSGAVYDWRYTWYSDRTGAESNPSPITSGLSLRRQAANVWVQGSPDPQTTHIRLYRRGGLLGQVGWRRVAQFVNVPSQEKMYVDNNADSQLALNPELMEDNDLPFITVTSPSSRGGGQELQGAPCAYIFGPFIGKYILACGDLNRPNHVYWTNPGRPTSSSGFNHVAVTSPDESLIGGFMYGGLPYVYSREAFYALDYNGDDAIPVFSSRRLPIGRGVSSPYSVAVGPQVFFLSKDGVYMSDMQGPAEPMTEKDIRPLFNPDQTSYDPEVQGVEQVDWGVYTLDPPNPTNITSSLNKVRMAWGGRNLRVHYPTTDNSWVHLVNDIPYDRWSNDYLATDNLNPEWEVIAYYDEEQPNTSWLIGTSKGRILREAGLTDDGNAIQCRVRTKSYEFDAPQTLKEFGNIVLDVDTNNANVPLAIDPLYPLGVAVTMYYNGETSSSSYQRINGTGRQKYPLSLSDAYVYSIALDLEWNGNARIYQWDFLWRMDEEWLTHWEFPPTSFGAKGWTHMRDFYLTLRSTGDTTVSVVMDGVTYLPAISGSSNLGVFPSTSGEKVKRHMWLPACKTKLYQVKLDGGPFRLYGEDSEIRVKEFATGLTYPIVNPWMSEGGGS